MTFTRGTQKNQTILYQIKEIRYLCLCSSLQMMLMFSIHRLSHGARNNLMSNDSYYQKDPSRDESFRFIPDSPTSDSRSRP